MTCMTFPIYQNETELRLQTDPTVKQPIAFTPLSHTPFSLGGCEGPEQEKSTGYTSLVR